uniref:Lymphocyte antigen 96 n=1 Tax=Salvator merianae TaxID=96440 RepID=A0A8D0C1J1_SALMN
MVQRYVNVLQLVIVSLQVCGDVVAQQQELLCETDDLKILYSSCGHYDDTFSLKIEPCSLQVSKWHLGIFWIPNGDITVLHAEVGIWHETHESLKFKVTLCQDEDDEYDFCGALKGETINTTSRASSSLPRYPKGNYTIILKVFSGHHKELILCMNYTLALLNDASPKEEILQNNNSRTFL